MNAVARLHSVASLPFVSLSLLAVSGCVGEVGSECMSGTDYECNTAVANCGVKNLALTVVALKPSASGACYGVANDLRVGKQAYCDRNWVVKRIDYPELRGAHWVMARAADSQSTADPFLAVQWLHDVKDVYLAYDSRAKTKPSWLALPTYMPVRDSSGKPYVIQLAQGSGDVDLEIWRVAKPPAKNVVFQVPGNFAGNPSGWPTGFNLADAAMYVLVIAPRQAADCSNPSASFTSNHAGCYGTGADAVTAAKSACEKDLAASATVKQVCGTPACASLAPCACAESVQKNLGVSPSPLTFRRHSEVEIDPGQHKAVATVELLGQKFTPELSGEAQLEYTPDGAGTLRAMRVNTMTLAVGPLSTKAGKISEVVIRLVVPARAECQDAFPPWATPCATYSIAPHGFLAREAAKRDGKQLVFLTSNTQPLMVTVDNAQRLFRIVGGPLLTMVKIDGERHRLRLSLDATGKFENFAPHAVGVESTRYVECGVSRGFDSSNRDPIRLDAAGSFDVYHDPIPSSAYRWFEDYGLVTEKALGQGAKVTLAPYTMSYGVHAVTLLVQDSHGVADSDSFEIEVGDSSAPTLTVPADRFVVATGKGPVNVDVGKGWAVDDCAYQVAIRNDAPAGGMFPLGTTKVTWEADDGRGHVTRDVQSVYVLSMAPLQPLPALEHLVELVGFAARAVERTRELLARCKPGEPCPAELGEIRAALEAAGSRLRQLELPREAERARAEALARLQRAQARLEESAGAVGRSRSALAEQQRLHRTAQETIADAERALTETRRVIDELRARLRTARDGDAQ